MSLSAAGFSPLVRELDLAEGALDLGNLKLEVGLRLRVRVVDRDGQGVADARVAAGTNIASADPTGLALLEGLPRTGLRRIVVSAPGYVRARPEVEAPLPKELRVVLGRSFTVTGRYLRPDGEGVADGEARLEVGRSFRTAALMPDGSFELALAPGSAAVLELRSPATRAVRLPLDAGGAGETRDLGEIRAQPGMNVSGRLFRGDTGAPVAGARVWALRESGLGPLVAWMTRDVVEAASSAEGLFDLPGLEPRPTLVRIEAAGLAPLRLPVTPREGGELVDLGDIELGRGATLEIRMEPEAADGAFAAADLGGQGLEVDRIRAQLRDGLAVIEHVPPERKITVTVSRGRARLCEEAVLAPGEGETLEIDCEKEPLKVAGTVLFGEAPASGGQLLWSREGPDVPGVVRNVVSPSGLRWQEGLGAPGAQVSVEVDSAGRFSADELLPGSWTVTWLSAGGAAVPPLEVSLSGEGDRQLRLGFAAGVLRGTVLDGDGDGVEGASVIDLESQALAFSDSDGRFALEGLAPGRARLQARRGGERSEVAYLEVEAGEESSAVELVLSDSEHPLFVSAVGAEGEPEAGALLVVEMESIGSRILTADADGRAELRLQPPLPARLRIAGYAGGRWAFAPWTSFEEARDGVILTFEASGSALIHSQSAAGELMLRGPFGWDVGRLIARLGLRQLVRPDEPLLVTGLPPGSYEVSLGDVARRFEIRVEDRTEIEL